MGNKYNSEAKEKGETKTKKRRSQGYFDYSLLAVWIFVMLLGFVLLYSASSYTGLTQYNDSFYFLKGQIKNSAIGLVLMLITIFVIKYEVWGMFAKILYFGSIGSIFLVLTPLGIEKNGAKRWVNLGIIQFQPAEAVKLAAIIMTAALLAKCSSTALRKGKTCWQIYSVSLVGAALLFFITSNLSSALIVAGVGAVMLIIAGAGIKFTGVIGAAGGIGAIGLIILAEVPNLGFRLQRIAVWKNPEEYMDGKGFQVMQGLYAIGSGGLFGKGLGNSAQKLGFVPEASNDMIFAIICEELGIFGAVCVVMLFVFLFRRMRVIASNAPDLFGTMLVIGIMAHLSIQVVLNIAVVTNTIPNTGVSLPFISYGGTALMFQMVEMGMVLSVSRRIKRIR